MKEKKLERLIDVAIDSEVEAYDFYRSLSADSGRQKGVVSAPRCTKLPWMSSRNDTQRVKLPKRHLTK